MAICKCSNPCDIENYYSFSKFKGGKKVKEAFFDSMQCTFDFIKEELEKGRERK